MNEIVRETPLSKGTVNNIIQDWKAKIMGTNIEEIKTFTSEVRKSGITIEECAQGFRLVQLLKKFDIHDEFDVNVNEDEFDHLALDADKSNSSLTNPNPSAQYPNKVAPHNDNANLKNTKLETSKIIYFLEQIYQNCKNHGITPSTMTGWIDDLLFLHDMAIESEGDNDYSDTISSDNNNFVEKRENEQRIRKEIPFVSRLSFYIDQKKKRIRSLENIKILVSKEINDLTKQRQDLVSRINKAIDIEKMSSRILNGMKI